MAEMSHLRRHRRASSGRVVGAVSTAALAALIGGLAWQARAEQTDSTRQLEHRFSERIDLATQYVQSDIADLRERELHYAMSQLSGTVTPLNPF